MKPVHSRFTLALALGAALVSLPACGTVVAPSASPVFLIVDGVEGASGAEDSPTWTQVLSSDVLTCVENCTGVQPLFVRFSDSGRIRLRLGLTDPGTPTTPTVPTSANFVTISRIKLVYRGVGGAEILPKFEGGLTGTVSSSSASTELIFVLVQAQQKGQAPLSDLIPGGTTLQSNVEITLFGKDQQGRDVTVSGTISIIFANWADPE